MGSLSGLKLRAFSRLRISKLLTSFFLISSIAVAAPAFAQNAVTDALAVAVQPSVETYDPSAAVSGSPIAGIAIGRASGTLPLDGMKLVAPRSDAMFCVHAITQDGRYILRGTYKAPPSGAVDVLAIRPLTQRYAKELGSVKAEQFAVRAFLATNGNCHPNNAVHLPQITGRGAVLVVAVNGGSRAGKAQLFDDAPKPAPISGTECRRPSGSARIAFDLLCELELPEKPAQAPLRLRVTLDDGFGPETHEVRVLLPRSAVSQ